MAKHVIQLLLVLLSVAARGLASDDCPPKEDVLPCSCEIFFGDTIVTCIDLQNSNQLRDALWGIKGRKIDTLVIRNSNLGHIPGHLFKDTSIKTITFSYTKITSIGDKENPPFSGLENSLRHISITEGFWDYDKPLDKAIPLMHLKKLVKLALQNNVISKLGNELFSGVPDTVEELFIVTGLVKEIGDKAFATLKNLKYFRFSGNSVTLPRSALHATLPHLVSLDLRDNKITELPSNFFTGFPSLKFVYLDDNALSTLPEDTWKNIINQLSYVEIQSNPLVCDSKIKWLVTSRSNERIYSGDCAFPQALSGRSLSSLTEEDISS